MNIIIGDRPIDFYKEFIRSNLPSWSLIPPEEIQMTKLTSYSREVYKVVALNKKIKPIIFRVITDTVGGKFKKPKGLFISNEEEVLVYSKAYEHNLGPKLYYQNNSYRIEEFIEGGKINYDSLYDPLFRRRLTYVISEWNKLSLKGLKRKESYFIDYFTNGKENFNKFSEVCSRKNYSEEVKIIMHEIKELVDIENIEYLYKLVKLDDNVFCHGDLNPLNMIYDRENNKITLIDYERAGLNLRGDDFGNFFFFNIFNHFFPNQPSVIESNIPTNEILFEMSLYYWVFTDLKKGEENKEFITKSIRDKCFFDLYVENIKTKEFESKVMRLIRQIKISLVVNIFYWCVTIVNMFGESDKAEPKIFHFFRDCFRLFKWLVSSNWVLNN
jgi:thiamine kinase-like enzyme